MQETRCERPRTSPAPGKSPRYRPGGQASCHPDGWIFAILDAAWRLFLMTHEGKIAPTLGRFIVDSSPQGKVAPGRGSAGITPFPPAPPPTASVWSRGGGSLGTVAYTSAPTSTYTMPLVMRFHVASDARHSTARRFVSRQQVYCNRTATGVGRNCTQRETVSTQHHDFGLLKPYIGTG
jgi:hypothetical protein